MNLLKKLFGNKEIIQEQPSINEVISSHNYNVSANIGLMLVNKFAQDRTFRRKMEAHFPDFCRQYYKQCMLIQQQPIEEEKPNESNS